MLVLPLSLRVIFTGYCNDDQSIYSAFANIPNPCRPNEYACHCSTNRRQSCDRPCIPLVDYRDGSPDCPDKSDEIHFFRTVSCGGCSVTIRRLPNIRECNELGHSLCDNSTCYETRSLRCSHNDCTDTEVICTSHCDTGSTNKKCKRAMQCTNGDLILASQFCDGSRDCRDFSDELQHHQGFKCFQSEDSCVLPQVNLFDDVAHCSDGSDLCLKENNSCYECSDTLLIISSIQVCDRSMDCFDTSDENSCALIVDWFSSRNLTSETFSFSVLFSTRFRMIGSVGILSAFWIIGIIVIIGNSIVIVTTIKLLRTTHVSDFLRCQYVIILNISSADFIMGVYLLTLAVFNEIFSEYYSDVDYEWRSSPRCSIIGSLAVISSEASCFLMVVLTSFRIYNICKPMASLSLSLLPWGVCIGASWLVAITIAILPIVHLSSNYFVHSYSFLGLYFSENELARFAIALAQETNRSLAIEDANFETIRNYLQTRYPDASPVMEFGYYGETEICLARLFVSLGDNAWEYTFAIVTINLLAFIYIVFGYIFIYVRSTNSSKKIRKIKSSKQEATMQRRIARIILTDFFCWIPICIISYVRLGTKFTNSVYQISAVFLLPINSALNPFLFSPLVDKLWKKICCCRKKQKR